MKKIFLISIIVFISILNIVSASDVLVWQGQYYTGTTFNTGTYEFNFSVYDALTEGNICYSNTTNLTTGSFGEWKTEQSGVSSICSNVSKDYFLNINIEGIDQTPRRRLTIFNFLRKDVNEVTAGDLVLHGVLQGLSPLKLQDEINFIKPDGIITSALYNAPRETSSTLPSAFADSLIHDIINETNNYGMQECFWDENKETMQMCISGAYLSGRATTISRSLQVVGNTTTKLVNENFTLCEGNNYVDCETDITGADLLVEDDIEAIGSIYSQENITAEYFIGDGSLLTGISSTNTQKNASGYLYNDSSTIYLNETRLNDTIDLRSVGEWNVSGSYLYPRDLTKKVGINKINPLYQLDINGEIGLDGYDVLDGIGDYIVLGDLDGGGSSGIKFYTDLGNEVVIDNGGGINANYFIANGKVQGEYYSNDGSQGITNTLDYHVCTSWNGASCGSWCTLRIKNGLIVGCA